MVEHMEGHIDCIERASAIPKICRRKSFEFPAKPIVNVKELDAVEYNSRENQVDDEDQLSQVQS